MPVVVVFESTGLKRCGRVPSANNFLPVPIVRGYVQMCIRSIRLCLRSVCIRLPLPHTHRSGPSEFLSFFSSFTTSPVISTELFQESLKGLCETTYFFVLLNGFATRGSSLSFGQ